MSETLRVFPAASEEAARELARALWDLHRPAHVRAPDEVTTSMGSVLVNPETGVAALVIHADELAYPVHPEAKHAEVAEAIAAQVAEVDAKDAAPMLAKTGGKITDAFAVLPAVKEGAEADAWITAAVDAKTAEIKATKEPPADEPIKEPAPTPTKK